MSQPRRHKMLKRFAVAAILLLLGQLALGMPCDTGYNCATKDNKYIVQLGACRYENRLTLEGAKVNGEVMSLATLGPAFDGKNVLTFQINIPTADDSVHVLSYEGLKITHRGEMLDESAAQEPAPMSVQHEAIMRCEVAD